MGSHPSLSYLQLCLITPSPFVVSVSLFIFLSLYPSLILSSSLSLSLSLSHSPFSILLPLPLSRYISLFLSFFLSFYLSPSHSHSIFLFSPFYGIFCSLDYDDLHDSKAALRDYIIWLEQKTNFSVESGNLSSESDVESSVSVSFLSPRRPSLKQNDKNMDEKIENRSISPYRVSFEDSRNSDDMNGRHDSYSGESKESVTALVKRSKSMSSNIITDREVLIKKQQALLLVIEKQLDAAQLRLQLEVEGAGQVSRYYFQYSCRLPSFFFPLFSRI